jgi:hypothetical protein
MSLQPLDVDRWSDYALVIAYLDEADGRLASMHSGKSRAEIGVRLRVIPDLPAHPERACWRCPPT